MNIRYAFLVACIVLSGCVTERYTNNMQHAHVSSNVRIPRAELEQIVRTITKTTINPIVCISSSSAVYSGEITVYTELQPEPQRFMDYDLQKQPDGLWHIISRGRSSVIACPD